MVAITFILVYSCDVARGWWCTLCSDLFTNDKSQLNRKYSVYIATRHQHPSCSKKTSNSCVLHILVYAAIHQESIDRPTADQRPTWLKKKHLISTHTHTHKVAHNFIIICHPWFGDGVDLVLRRKALARDYSRLYMNTVSSIRGHTNLHSTYGSSNDKSANP